MLSGLPVLLLRDNDYLQLERLGNWFSGYLGNNFNQRRYVHLAVNGTFQGSRSIPDFPGVHSQIYEDTQQPERNSIEIWYPSDSGGPLYKLEVYSYDESFPILANVFHATVESFFSRNYFLRSYYRSLKAVSDGPMVSTTVGPLISQIATGLSGGGLSPSPASDIATWISTRKTTVTSFLNSAQATFDMSSPAPPSYSATTTASTFPFSGSAPVEVKNISIAKNGSSVVPSSFARNSLTTWSGTVSLSAGLNTFVVTGLDRNDAPITGMTKRVNITKQLRAFS